jgi:hypothetical protein
MLFVYDAVYRPVPSSVMLATLTLSLTPAALSKRPYTFGKFEDVTA